VPQKGLFLYRLRKFPCVVMQNGKEYEFGVFLDPQALIEAVKSK
jgi:hypothetical protein